MWTNSLLNLNHLCMYFHTPMLMPIIWSLCLSLSLYVIQCFSADVVESAEVASGRTTLGGYALGDLVNLGSGMLAMGPLNLKSRFLLQNHQFMFLCNEKQFDICLARVSAIFALLFPRKNCGLFCSHPTYIYF
jgi:hypothetical protein